MSVVTGSLLNICRVAAGPLTRSLLPKTRSVLPKTKLPTEKAKDEIGWWSVCATSHLSMSPDGTTRIFITPALGAGYAFLACHRFRKLAATPASPVPSSNMLVGSGTFGPPLRTTMEKFAAASSGFWLDAL
jgi:hypothetical protein